MTTSHKALERQNRRYVAEEARILLLLAHKEFRKRYIKMPRHPTFTCPANEKGAQN